jgi:lactoylglutathione lyase
MPQRSREASSARHIDVVGRFVVLLHVYVAPALQRTAASSSAVHDGYAAYCAWQVDTQVPIWNAEQPTAACAAQVSLQALPPLPPPPASSPVVVSVPVVFVAVPQPAANAIIAIKVHRVVIGVSSLACAATLSDVHRRAWIHRPTSVDRDTAPSPVRPSAASTHPSIRRMTPMKLGYVIVYSQDVPAALAFYERAFGLSRRFLHESNTYGELDTGATVLAFAHDDMAAQNGLTVRFNRPAEPAAGVELALVTDDVAAAYATALAAGAVSVSAPEQKPWGQTVAYVRDGDGVLVELCSPMG